MIVLYSTGCPKCKILEAKLNAKGIQYSTVTDVNLMLSKGFNLMPVLEANGQIMDFKSANEWINNQ